MPMHVYGKARDGDAASPLETVQVADHIATFTARTFAAGVAYRVQGANSYDTVTFGAAGD